MRYLSISHVAPGMILGRTVVDAAGTTLIKAGVTLSDRYISRLRELGYPALYIRTSPLDDDFDLAEPVRAATRHRAQASLQRLALSLEVKGVVGDKLEAVSDSVHDLVDDVLQSRELVINMLEVRSFDDYTFGHSVNTCVLALMVGATAGLGRDDLVTLATGTLLHDLGKIFIPTEILNKPAALTTEEFGVVKDHCQRGYVLLKDQISPLAAHIAFQHHERCNGSGYPRGLDASGTIALAKLTAVADSFDAMTSNRVYRRAMLPERAAAILLQEAPAKYEADYVKTLAQLVAPYPIGCRVRLDTGEQGDVASASRTQTFVALVDGPRAGQIVVCPDEAVITSAEEW